jgi:sugar (pentulose or hexulose) kinase
MHPDREIVIGLDSSTTATKAIAWRPDGSLAGEGRSPIPLSSPAPDRYEQDPEDWWRSACEALRELLQSVDPGAVAAIAISNQRETFVPLAQDGRSVRPAIVWLDRRCGEEVAWLTGRIGGERFHRITGKPPDIAPAAYRIAWMLRHEPELFRRTAMFADVHAYLAWRLTGGFRTSWASADPLGLFDLERKTWSPEVLGALDLSVERLPVAVSPGTVVGVVSAAAADATFLRPDTPVVAGGGDGQVAGVGVNALGCDRAYLNLGTAVVGGIYSDDYRIGRAWRTMGSCSGDGYYFETSLRAGAFLLDWFAREVCGQGPQRVPDLAQLEAEAAAVTAGSDGLLALPYWGAVMTPYWDPLARGCWVGLSGFHRRGHLYRSLLEGIALEQALVTDMIEDAAGVTARDFVAIGGGAASDLWCQIMADATGRSIRRATTLEASSLGAAVCAAVGAGLYGTAVEAAAAMSGKALRETSPSPDSRAVYADLLGIYRELYPGLRRTFARLEEGRRRRADSRAESGRLAL